MVRLKSKEIIVHSVCLLWRVAISQHIEKSCLLGDRRVSIDAKSQIRTREIPPRCRWAHRFIAVSTPRR